LPTCCWFTPRSDYRRREAADKAAHNISNLIPFWGKKRADDVNADNCNAYANDRPPAAARRDLEVLRAALLYWNKHKAALSRIPAVVLPDKSQPRERWLTQEEARRLRKAAMKHPHLYRFVILGLKTGSRSGVLLSLRWDQIDLAPRRDGPEGDRRDRGQQQAQAAGEARQGRGAPDAPLEGQGRQDPHVIHYDGLPIKKLRRSWAAACKEAKIRTPARTRCATPARPG
jgi:integrase